MSDTAILSSKFRISIPKAVREVHGWKAGQAFAFISKGAGVMLVPVPEAADLFGVAEGADGVDFRDRDDRSVPPKVSPAKGLANVLTAMPDVGRDEDFARVDTAVRLLDPFQPEP